MPTHENETFVNQQAFLHNLHYPYSSQLIWCHITPYANRNKICATVEPSNVHIIGTSGVCLKEVPVFQRLLVFFQ